MKIIFTDNTKTRLDTFIAPNFPISRSKVQKMITDGVITVNGKKTIPHHWLKTNDVVEYTKKEVLATEKKVAFKGDPSVAFDVIEENDDFIIINKPAGLMVHPTERNEPGTLAHGLLAKYPELKKVGESPVRPGIVHRLDRDVSGLMLIARTPKAYAYYKNLFMERTIHKTYLALVHGIMEQPNGTFSFRIGRSKTRGRMAARPAESEEGKDAVTHYTVLKTYPHLSYVKVTIETGRTHQIRAHFFATQHPVVGDRLYRLKNAERSLDLNRLFLHSAELSFTDSHGKERHFEAPLPPELQKMLTTLDETPAAPTPRKRVQ